MVVFGAGASFGSRPGDSDVTREDEPGLTMRRPPLTKDLFSRALSGYANKYPTSRPAIVLLREEMAANPAGLIEAAIGRFAEDALTNPERARHMLALRFYLWELIATETETWWAGLNGFTHYAELLARLGRWRAGSGEPVALVTFNYDELLDRSLEAQAGDLRLNSFDSYIDREDWRLYKLHGSVGWSRGLDRLDGMPINAGPEQLIPAAHELRLDEGELLPQSWQHARDQMIGQRMFVPGIAVPTDRKNTFECPLEHRDRFVSEVMEVDRLLTIGWRGSEQHVQQILSEHLRPGYRLAICDITQPNVRAIHNNLGLAGKKGTGPTEFARGFTGLLAGGELEHWLQIARPGHSG